MYNITLCRLAVLKRWSRFEEHIRRYPPEGGRTRRPPPALPDLPIRIACHKNIRSSGARGPAAIAGTSSRGLEPAAAHAAGHTDQPRTLSVRVGSCNWRFGKSVRGVAQHYGREGRPPVAITWGARPASSMDRAPSPSRSPSPCEQALWWTCPLCISDSIRTRAPENKYKFVSKSSVSWQTSWRGNRERYDITIGLELFIIIMMRWWYKSYYWIHI